MEFPILLSQAVPRAKSGFPNPPAPSIRNGHRQIVLDHCSLMCLSQRLFFVRGCAAAHKPPVESELHERTEKARVRGTGHVARLRSGGVFGRIDLLRLVIVKYFSKQGERRANILIPLIVEKVRRQMLYYTLIFSKCCCSHWRALRYYRVSEWQFRSFDNRTNWEGILVMYLNFRRSVLVIFGKLKTTETEISSHSSGEPLVHRPIHAPPAAHWCTLPYNAHLAA